MSTGDGEPAVARAPFAATAPAIRQSLRRFFFASLLSPDSLKLQPLIADKQYWLVRSRHENGTFGSLVRKLPITSCVTASYTARIRNMRAVPVCRDRDHARSNDAVRAREWEEQQAAPPETPGCRAHSSAIQPRPLGLHFCIRGAARSCLSPAFAPFAHRAGSADSHALRRCTRLSRPSRAGPDHLGSVLSRHRLSSGRHRRHSRRNRCRRMRWSLPRRSCHPGREHWPCGACSGHRACADTPARPYFTAAGASPELRPPLFGKLRRAVGCRGGCRRSRRSRAWPNAAHRTDVCRRAGSGTGHNSGRGR